MRVIVLGGGLMGTASAFFLARRGLQVTLIDRAHIGAGATVASFGNVRRSGRALSQLSLARRSLDLWNRAEDLLGRDVEFRATGHLRLIFDTDSLDDMRRFAAAAAPHGFDPEELTPQDIRRRFAGLGPEAIAASPLCIHNPSTGREQVLPHAIAPADTQRHVVVVGAGPGGLEAARVAALRGHRVTVFEAASDPGGQIRLTAQSPRRREMLSIIGWRMAECERLGVRFHFNTYAEPDTLTGARPDVVIIATGGLPHTVPLSEGTDLAVTAWDILSGDVSPGREVLIFDNAGDTAGLQAAETIAATGARVEIVSPDRGLSHEVMPMTLTPFLRALQDREVTFTVTWRLTAIRRQGNALEAVLGSDWSGAVSLREVNQVVVNNGTQPLDDLYLALKPLSSNLGAVDHAALLALRPQTVASNASGRFQLFRIGDAVASRNTHAAVLDALRLTRAV